MMKFLNNLKNKNKQWIAVVLLLALPQSFAQLAAGQNSKKHSKACFTQGLIIQNNIVWESCGGYGISQLKKWDIETGKVIKRKRLDKKYFAEGLTEFNGDIYVLTWQAQKAFKVDKDTLEITQEFKYKGQGWGLTHDGSHLIMSNGSSTLQFLNPKTFEVIKTVQVQINGSAINYLNELEWIDGKIWANIFQTDYIVVIDPQSGNVVDKYHLPNLLIDYIQKPGVLNGIAYDETTKKTWVTGKNWPLIFE
ncbi:MAG: glutaminyl-peptide cyclotransferase, partial [Marinicellaceae bacterium]